MNGKYIVVKSRNGEFAVVFGPGVNHDDMANRFGGKERILGAGEFSTWVTQDRSVGIRCFGKSVSLDIESRKHLDSVAVKWAVFGDTSGIEVD
jgi:hypothetical protein